MTVHHLIQTAEAFSADLELKYGKGAQLHPVNRLTRCGKRSADVSSTTATAEVTCRTCKDSVRRAAQGIAPLWPGLAHLFPRPACADLGGSDD